MNQYFIKKGTSESLVLIFTGWASDERFFAELPETDTDICICSDYRSLQWDEKLFLPYKDICVVAWSMGVFVAEKMLADTNLPLSQAVAFNGTPFPVDDERGIPEAIYDGTESTLTPDNLLKFYRRMCGSSNAYKELLQQNIYFSVEALREALRNIKTFSQKSRFNGSSIFTKVIIGSEDRIFPPENQKKAWDNHPFVRVENIPHYDKNRLNQLIIENGNK
jgi:hypothetical protein